jgi:hypothetical protein
VLAALHRERMQAGVAAAEARATLFLAGEGVALLATGAFGNRFIPELEERVIIHVQMSGLISDVIVELISRVGISWKDRRAIQKRSHLA